MGQSRIKVEPQRRRSDWDRVNVIDDLLIVKPVHRGRESWQSFVGFSTATSSGRARFLDQALHDPPTAVLLRDRRGRVRRSSSF
jgi:hypothetical protein